MYEKDFDPKFFKSTKIGPSFQITDNLPTGDSQNAKEAERADEVWNPDRISTDSLGKWTLYFLISTMCHQTATSQI